MMVPVFAIFDLPGPEFLALYVVLGILTFVISIALRQRVMNRFEAANQAIPEPRAWPPEVVAYATGGDLGVLRMAIAGLTRRGLAQPLPSGRFHCIDAARSENTSDLSPAESALFAAGRVLKHERGTTLQSCLPLMEAALAPIRTEAERLGVALDAAWKWSYVSAARLPWLPVILVGVIKAGVGASRGRPIALLVLTMVGYFVLAAKLGNTPRPQRARAIVARLAERATALKPAMRQSPEMLTPHEAMLGAALFGLTAFGNELAAFDRQVQSATVADTTTSSCSSSSCGSSCGGGCGGCS
jgi:uncharacterized protein (TIGR04222 family)